MAAEDKLNAIEETLAHQEQQIHDLSEIVIRQGREIDALKKHALKMQDKIASIEDAAKTGEGEALTPAQQAARDKPPHY